MQYFYDSTSTSLYVHCILPAATNKEGLFQLQKAAMLTNEVTMWLDENIGANDWYIAAGGSIIGFIAEEDAMAFMLRWS